MTKQVSGTYTNNMEIYRVNPNRKVVLLHHQFHDRRCSPHCRRLAVQRHRRSSRLQPRPSIATGSNMDAVANKSL
ncbi:hypothetical protein A2U01_0000622 [Trifolium medium]|uniref:Uncharacterized protein n=1 Tax=Trifolium medium TaxID=97028 RepID=A0A392LY32_9FABA|nr:hypothetical protein [Trifolium medium]